MNKKLFVSIAILIGTIFCCTFSNATAGNMIKNTIDNAANTTRNVVGGTENTVENIGNGISNTAKGMTGATENTMNYTARRVSTNNMGMGNNMWTWLIVGIAVAAIIGIIWYYSMQFSNNNYNDNNRSE